MGDCILTCSAAEYSYSTLEWLGGCKNSVFNIDTVEPRYCPIQTNSNRNCMTLMEGIVISAPNNQIIPGDKAVVPQLVETFLFIFVILNIPPTISLTTTTAPSTSSCTSVFTTTRSTTTTSTPTSISSTLPAMIVFRNFEREQKMEINLFLLH
jgi:hypothetical protein